MGTKTTALLLFLCLGVHAQVNLDSLWSVWNDSTQNDTNKLNAIDKIARDRYRIRNPDSLFYLAKMEYDLAEATGHQKWMAKALNMQGTSFDQRSDYSKAKEYYLRSLKMYEEIGQRAGMAASLVNVGNVYRHENEAQALDYYEQAATISEEINDTFLLSNALNNIGIIYQDQGDDAKAINYYTRSMTLMEACGNIKGTSIVLSNIGIIYMQQGEYDKAIDYFNQSLKIKEEIGFKKGIASAINNLGVVSEEQGDYIQAKEYYTQSLKISEEIGDKYGIAFYLNNIGFIYLHQGDHTIANDYFTKSLKIREEIGDKFGKAESLNSIGLSYQEHGAFSKAISYSSRAFSLANEIGMVRIIQSTSGCLYESYKALGKTKEALEMYETYVTMNDSLQREENQREVIRQEYKYEYEKEALSDSLQFAKKEMIKNLELKKSENTKWFFVAMSFLTLVLAGFVFYGFTQKQRVNRYLKERNKFEIENKRRAIALFGQQVSKEVALELLSTSFESGSKKLFACIMFLDIRDFTPFVAKKEPSEIIQYQNDVFGFMIELIVKHHGIINQFMGDGFMATFGAPASSGNDTQNAVDASLEILMVLKKKCNSGEIPQTKIGIGLHAGDIVTGNVGTTERKQYSITGNTVILASRIEQLNKEFDSEILISREVLDRIDRRDLNAKNLGTVNLKGRVEPMEIVRLS